MRASVRVKLADKANQMRAKRKGTSHVRTVYDAVLQSYRIRRCFLCGVIGSCAHREPDVEIALLGAPGRRLI